MERELGELLASMLMLRYDACPSARAFLQSSEPIPEMSESCAGNYDVAADFGAQCYRIQLRGWSLR